MRSLGICGDRMGLASLVSRVVRVVEDETFRENGILMDTDVFFSWSVDFAAQYAQSPLILDHFRQYSRQTSPQRHFSLDPRSTLHTAVNTPDISPDRSAASTPGLASGAHGSHAGSTRKAKYTRSRTGCLGCRVKRVKCDEGRPECKRCVNAKRGVSRRSLIVVLLYVTKTDALLFSPRAYLLDELESPVRLPCIARSAESDHPSVGCEEETGFGGFDGR